MDDLTKITLIALLIGDVNGSPFFPLFDQDQYLNFLILGGGNVMKAARWAAISASMIVGSYNTRERVGEEEVWSSFGTNYLAALKMFLGNSSINIPDGLMPWAAGMSRQELIGYALNPDRVPNNLLEIYTCPSDNIVSPCWDRNRIIREATNFCLD